MNYRSIDGDRLLALSVAALGTSTAVQNIGSEMQTQIDKVSHLVGDAPSAGTTTTGAAEELAVLAGFAQEHALIYIDDVRPLEELTELGFWLPDLSGLGWDASATVSENLDRIVRSGEPGGTVIGVATGLLERYRRWDQYVPRQGSPAITALLGHTARQAPLLPGYTPAGTQNGVAVVRTPSGLLIPETAARAAAHDTNIARFSQAADPHFDRETRRAFTPDPERGRPPRWARNAGRGLGVVGVGLTVYDSARSQWEHDQQYHPDMGTTERVARAGYNVATEGGGAIAGGLAGAKIGATLGAFGGPVGAVVGGVVGGAIGGFIGSKAGQAVGRGIKEGGKAIANGAKKVWKGLFG